MRRGRGLKIQCKHPGQAQEHLFWERPVTHGDAKLARGKQGEVKIKKS